MKLTELTPDPDAKTTFGCKHCGSARLESLGVVMNHEHRKCQACGHLHIGWWRGGTLYHDRYCCDRIYQKGGGAEGSTATSRALHAAAVADRDTEQ